MRKSLELHVPPAVAGACLFSPLAGPYAKTTAIIYLRLIRTLLFLRSIRPGKGNSISPETLIAAAARTEQQTMPFTPSAMVPLYADPNASERRKRAGAGKGDPEARRGRRCVNVHWVGYERRLLGGRNSW